MGWDGDRPTRCLDALVHEIDPGTARPSIAIRGTPSSSWSKGAAGPKWMASATTGSRGTRSTSRRGAGTGTATTAIARPVHELLVGAHAVDVRHEPPRGRRARAVRQPPGSAAGLPRRSGQRSLRAASSPHRSGDEEAPLGPHPYALRRAGDPRDTAGTRTKFLNDRAIGNQASGSRR